MSGEPFPLPSIDAADAVAAFRAGTITLVDFRKPDAVRRSDQLIAGALCRDPFAFGHDDPLTSHRGPVAAFCVHGHEVSRFAAALMMLHGVDARYVRGGFEELACAGAPVVAIPPTEETA